MKTEINSDSGSDGTHNYCRYANNVADWKIWCYTSGVNKEECKPLPPIIETSDCIENKEVITCPVPCDSNNFYKVNENVEVEKYESDILMLPKILTLSSQILNPKNYEIRFLSFSLDGLPLNSEMDSFIKISADKT